MKEVVLITGSGNIARRLAEKLVGKGYSVRFLSRKKRGENYFIWDIQRSYLDPKALDKVSHVVHLAGESVMGKRWSRSTKRSIINSRVHSAQLLLDVMHRRNIRITSLISASAIGYYGSKTMQHIYAEDDDKGDDFLSHVCDQWEAVTDLFMRSGMASKVVKIRIGIVLSNTGGALPKVQLPVRYYLGSILGTGQQYMPWIHIDDVCGIMEYAMMHKKVTGVLNAVSPEHIMHENFMKTLAQHMNKPILMPRIPAFLLKLIFGEAAALLLEGSRVSSEKIRNVGFVFTYPTIQKALQNLIVKEY